jgi:hypothetical protein
LCHPATKYAKKDRPSRHDTFAATEGPLGDEGFDIALNGSTLRSVPFLQGQAGCSGDFTLCDLFPFLLRIGDGSRQ